MIDENWIRARITQLRIMKNVSEYKMSRDLGHSKSYINNIVLGKAMTPVKELLDIISYLDVTPSEFFDPETVHPVLQRETELALRNLDEQDMLLILQCIQRLKRGPIKE